MGGIYLRADRLNLAIFKLDWWPFHVEQVRPKSAVLKPDRGIVREPLGQCLVNLERLGVLVGLRVDDSEVCEGEREHVPYKLVQLAEVLGC